MRTVPGVIGLAVVAALVAPTATAGARPAPDGTGIVGDGVAVRADPHYCDGCTPPLTYSGGPVMTTAGGLTVTPVYWVPPGGDTFPSDYQSIIDGYIHNVAAASGSTGNVYSIDTEYYQKVNGSESPLAYSVKAGNPITDTDPFPADGCTPDAGFSACLTDGQLRDELSTVVSKDNLPTGLAQLYVVLFAPKVETQDLDGSNSNSGYCGYHRSFGSGDASVVYANIPFYSDGCGIGQEPNGSYAADGAINTLSHELNEAATDPTEATAWNDSTGHEIGDICADAYGDALGSTSSSHPDTTEYNQVINGGKYYTQEEFSNQAFSAQGFGNGCQQNEAGANTKATPAAPPTTAATIFSDASPFTLPADGSSTTDDRVVISDRDGNAIAGDQVTFSEYVNSGGGHCGTLSTTGAKTGDDGTVTATYTTSKDNVVCDIVATEASGGHSSQSIIYQGASESTAPTATADFPSQLRMGAAPTTFTMTVQNHSDAPISSARVDLVVFPYGSSSPNVPASDVRISYSTTGPNGDYTDMALTGSTVNHGGIDGMVGPKEGMTLAPAQSETVSLTVALDSNTPAASGQPTLSLEGFLDQIDPASGSGTTLADTNATDVTVPVSSTPWWVIVVAVVGGLLLIGAVTWLVVRRRHRPQAA